MSRILELVDTSAVVYAGAVNKYAYISGDIRNTPDGYREQIIPMGGVNQIFNLIAKHRKEGTMVFCCDRPPTEKRKKYPGYKNSRKPNQVVNIQKNIAEYVLNDCGFSVAAEDGYEADDLIYSCVRKFKSQYDHIYIYTGDSDLYFLVDDNVSILPPHSKAREVNMQNYSYSAQKDVITRYNAMPLVKLFKGDPSKGIPSLSSSMKDYLIAVLANDQTYPIMGDRERMRACIETVCPELLWNYDLLSPIEVKVDDEYFAPDNDDRLRAWAGKIKHKLIRGKNIDLRDNIEELLALGLYIEQ